MDGQTTEVPYVLVREFKRGPLLLGLLLTWFASYHAFGATAKREPVPATSRTNSETSPESESAGQTPGPPEVGLPGQEESPEELEKRKQRLLWHPMIVPEHEAVSPLISMGVSANPTLRCRAIEGLVASDSSELIPFVIYSLSDPMESVREKAMEALYDLDADAVTEAILAVLAWGEPPVVLGVDAALPALRTIVEPGLLRALDEPKSTAAERIGAAYGLGRIGSVRALQPLAEKVWGDDSRLSVYAANAIVAIDDGSTLQTLARMVQHTDPNVRVAAYYGLARQGGPEALGLLTAAASPGGEPDVRVKREVVRDLGLIGDESTVHFLIGLVRARSGFVQSAIEALALITGLPQDLQRERWLEWYEDTFDNKQEELTVAPSPIVPVPERSPILGVPPGGLPIIPRTDANG